MHIDIKTLKENKQGLTLIGQVGIWDVFIDKIEKINGKVRISVLVNKSGTDVEVFRWVYLDKDNIVDLSDFDSDIPKYVLEYIKSYMYGMVSQLLYY